jgi:hypothetical protein
MLVLVFCEVRRRRKTANTVGGVLEIRLDSVEKVVTKPMEEGDSSSTSPPSASSYD